MCKPRIFFLLIIGVYRNVEGYSGGSPTSQCADMVPNHSMLPKQQSVAPFEVQVSKSTYSPGESLKVTLKSTGFIPFKGFLLEARDELQTSILGGFTEVGSQKTVACGQGGNEAVTHSSASSKTSETFTWKAPIQDVGNIMFVATFVQDYSVFWTDVQSSILTQTVATTSKPASTTKTSIVSTTPVTTAKMSTMAEPTTQALTPEVTTKKPDHRPDAQTLSMDVQCGATKGCFVDCKQDGCNYVVTWEPMGEWMEFTLSSKIDPSISKPWIAIAFSTDLKMGSDDVTHCIYDNGNVNVGRSYNDGKSNIVLLSDEGLKNTMGELVNGVFTCAFQRIIKKTKNTRNKRQINGEFMDLNEDFYLMFGDGPSTTGTMLGMHKRNPDVTPRKVDFQSTEVIGDKAKHPLVKVHASLMVVAWIFCTGVGLVLAKFYKPVWSKRTIMGLKVWFQLHRGLMVTTLVATVIGFVIIFAEVGGYSEIAKIPGKEYTQAHPILGIIVTILCIINPIMALFRPDPKSKNRAIFNWAHWADGMAAHILSVLTICFGVKMQKSTAPDYTVFVVIGYAIYQVLMEVTLKIFDLCIERHEIEKVEAMEMKNGNSNQNGNSHQNGNSTTPKNGNNYKVPPPEYTVSANKKDPKDSAIKKILFVFHVLVTLAFTLTLVLLVSMY